MYVNVYVLIVNTHVNTLFHVIHPYVLIDPVYQSDHHENVYHVFAITSTALHVPRYWMNCGVVQLNTHHVVVVNVNVYVLIVKYAVNVLFPVTKSCLVVPVYQSDHHENVYHVFATAVTLVPVLL